MRKEQIKIFLQKNGIMLAVCVYIVIAGAFFYFLVRPLQERIVEKASEIEQEKIDQDITKKKIMTVPVIEKDYKKYKENEEKLNVMIEPSQEVDFIKTLEKLAEETQNKIELRIEETGGEIKKKKGEEDGIKEKLANTNFLSMKIALEGNYQSLLKFLHKLENSDNYVNVISLRSEKILINTDTGESAAFVSREERSGGEKEILNSALDIVVYIKK